MAIKIIWKRPESKGGVFEPLRGESGTVNGRNIISIVSKPYGFSVMEQRWDAYWFFVVHENDLGIPPKSTYDTPCETIRDAEWEAEDYVRQSLKDKS